MNVETPRMALTPAEKMKRLRAARKKRSECSRCGAKVRKGTNCKACNAEAAEYVYESRGKAKKYAEAPNTLVPLTRATGLDFEALSDNLPAVHAVRDQ